MIPPLPLLSMLQSVLDLLLFLVYFSITLFIFVVYQKANIYSIREMFPNLWILAMLFFIFRGLQNGFEALIRLSLIPIEASVMQTLFKFLVLTVLILILLVIRQNYYYLISLSLTIAKVKRDLQEGD